MKNLKYQIIVASASVISFYLFGAGIFSIGKIINNFFPCEQKIENSFVCWMIYDVYFMIFLVFIFIISTLIIVFRITKNYKK
ncbi:MAG: hypothetical protein KAT32_03995 [Candidatus Moranbacteria bacterium]|nr:hypothetical protein [Candidatus Moranbacteria bacterium]